MASSPRPVVRVRRHVAASVLGRSYAVYGGMSGDTGRFSAPNPPLAELKSQIDKVEELDKQAKAGTKGAAKARDVELVTLVGMLRTECAYVRTLCDAAPGRASMIIQAAGFSESAVRVQEQPLLEVSLRGSGTVLLDAAVAVLLNGKLHRSHYFEWEWTLDGGATFAGSATTSKGETTVRGLAPLTTVGFRVRATIGDVPGPWSPTVSVVVH